MILASATLFVTLCACFATRSLALQAAAKEVSYVDATKCGTTDDLAYRVEVCAKPWMDLVQGTIEKWPRNTKDATDLCLSFGGCEKCIRENAKKCAQGFYKTIIGTVGSSVQRARKRECQTANLGEILKTTLCYEKNQRIVHSMMSNITSHFSLIENDMKDLDVKTNALCCMVNDLQANVRRTMASICREETELVIRVLRTVLQDAIDVICRAPKCQNVFKGYKVVTVNTDRFGGMIASILRIAFSLG